MSMLEILYQDDHYVAINKPAGLLVHRSNIDRQERRFAIQLLRDQIGCKVYPVHRLDKPTSGVLLFALDCASTQQAATLFSQKQAQKRYLAIVRGYTERQGCIEYALRPQHDRYDVAGQNERNLEKQRAAGQSPALSPQEAKTHFTQLAQVELPVAVGRYSTSRYSMLSLTPVTGRRHQLRRHMKHIFHPIIGDTSHGDGHHNRMFRQQMQSHRLLLASVRLEFRHPYTGQTLAISAHPGAEFEQVAERLGWALPDSSDLP